MAKVKCARCGLELEYFRGAQWAGWIAPAETGSGRDTCEPDEHGVWLEHRPAPEIGDNRGSNAWNRAVLDRPTHEHRMVAGSERCPTCGERW